MLTLPASATAHNQPGLRVIPRRISMLANDPPAPRPNIASEITRNPVV